MIQHDSKLNGKFQTSKSNRNGPWQCVTSPVLENAAFVAANISHKTPLPVDALASKRSLCLSQPGRNFNKEEGKQGKSQDRIHETRGPAFNKSQLWICQVKHKSEPRRSETAVNRSIKIQSSVCLSCTMSRSHAASNNPKAKPLKETCQMSYSRRLKHAQRHLQTSRDDTPRDPNQHSANVNGPLSLVHSHKWRSTLPCQRQRHRMSPNISKQEIQAMKMNMLNYIVIFK